MWPNEFTVCEMRPCMLSLACLDAALSASRAHFG